MGKSSLIRKEAAAAGKLQKTPQMRRQIRLDAEKIGNWGDETAAK